MIDPTGIGYPIGTWRVRIQKLTHGYGPKILSVTFVLPAGWLFALPAPNLTHCHPYADVGHRA
jgi:hypothetical protein